MTGAIQNILIAIQIVTIIGILGILEGINWIAVDWNFWSGKRDSFFWLELFWLNEQLLGKIFKFLARFSGDLDGI